MVAVGTAAARRRTVIQRRNNGGDARSMTTVADLPISPMPNLRTTRGMSFFASWLSHRPTCCAAAISQPLATFASRGATSASQRPTSASQHAVTSCPLVPLLLFASCLPAGCHITSHRAAASHIHPQPLPSFAPAICCVTSCCATLASRPLPTPPPPSGDACKRVWEGIACSRLCHAATDGGDGHLSRAWEEVPAAVGGGHAAMGSGSGHLLLRPSLLTPSPLPWQL